MAFQITKDCNGCGFCAQWCPTRAIQGRKKQRYAIQAESCIECGACGRICGHHAVVDGAGRIQERIRLSEWQKPVWEYPRCDGCENCVRICPSHSIGMDASKAKAGGSGAPYLAKQSSCISCGFCQKACTTGAINLIKQTDIAYSQ